MADETSDFPPAKGPNTAVSRPGTSDSLVCVTEPNAGPAKTGSNVPNRLVAPIFNKERRPQRGLGIGQQFLALASLDPTQLGRKVEDWPKIEFRGVTYVPESWFEKHSKRTSWVKEYGCFLAVLVNNKVTEYRWFCLQNNNRCNKSYSANSTGNAMDHLTKDHKIPAPSEQTERLAKRRKTHYTQQQHQDVLETLKNSTRGEPLTASLAEMVRQNTVNWVLDASVPFKMVTNKYFQKVIELVSDSSPTLLPTSASTVRDWINTRYEEVLSEVQAEIASAVTPIHLSFDKWTSPSQSAFIAIVGHYLDASLQQKTRLLRVKHLRGRHRGAEELAPEILDVADSYQFKAKVGYLVADNDPSNDTCAAELIATLFPNLSLRQQTKQKSQRRLRCLGHVISLVAKAILSGENKSTIRQLAAGSEEKLSAQTEITLLKEWRRLNAVGKLRAIAYTIRNRPQRKEKFRDVAQGQVTEEDFDKFGDLEVDPEKGLLYLKGDNDTRWNPVYFMIERAIALRSPLEFLCKMWVDNGSLEADALLSEEDWEILGAFLELLTPLKSATKLYEGNGITLPGCISALYTLKRHLERQAALHDTPPAYSTAGPQPNGPRPASRSPSPPPASRPRRNPALPRNLAGYEVDLLPSQQRDPYPCENDNTIHPGSPRPPRSPSSSPEPEPAPRRRAIPFIATSVRLGLKILTEYIQEMEVSSAYWSAMVLHPQYRTKYLDIYFGQAKRDEVVGALRRLYRDEYKDLQLREAPAVDQGPGDAHTEFLFGGDYLPPLVESNAIDEVAVYLSEPPYQVQDPIQWWKDNEGRFPRLSKMAFTLLSIPGMSAECEHVFSQAKLLLTSQRQGMSEATVGEFLVAKHYLRSVGL